MNAALSVERDERTIVVENASYRLAYLVLSFGLLVLVAIRSFVNHENSWDLLGLVILAGGVAAVYQIFYRVVFSRWTATVLATVIIAAGIAALLVMMR
jgi:hypothetical protein